MALPNDIARCHGVRTADTVRPIDYCQGCRRWQEPIIFGPSIPYLTPPPAVIRTLGTGAVLLVCDQRITG